MAVTAANPEATAEAGPAANPLDRLREAFERLSNQQKMILAVALAAIVALIVGTILWSRQPEYKVLFSNLGEKDGGAIIAILEQQNTPHKMSDSGAILVPSERVHEVRLKLASQGLPRGGSVGFELMENQKFGISQFAEQVNYQRGLEGELARTIQSIGAVQLARVHLAIPKPTVFVREEQKPTASVMLNLYPGRELDGAQVAGITHLVSSSVPQLPISNVTVIDQNGTLLSKLKSKLTEAGLDPSQIKYVREVEDGIIKRIEEILKPVLGSENYKVQVAADVDFNHVEQTAESYKPNATPGSTSIRSQQNTETANVNQTTGGVPGALTNQPPVPAIAPLTVPNIGGTPGQPAKPGEPAGKVDIAGVTAPLQNAAPPLSTSKNATINYEVDKTVRYTKQAMGSIRRLSTAVVVNYRKEAGKDGKLAPKALPEAELKQINDLVREAMGYNKERGDTLSVANSPFTATEKAETSVPVWKDPESISFAKELVKYLFIAAIIAYLLIKVVQPILKTMFPPPEDAAAALEAAALAAGLPGVEVGEEQVEINHFAAKVQKARDIAQNDPNVVANIIKDWMGANG